MRIKIIFQIVVVILFTSCKKDHMLDCFKSAGSTVTVERTATPFNNIDLNDNVDLIINPNSTPYIKVTAGENLVDGIITEIDGGTIYIRNENKCNWMRSFKNTYTVEIGMDKPMNITYYGSGNISCKDTIRSEDFVFTCKNGSGTINFLFNSPHTHLNISTGRCDIHAKGYAELSDIYLNDVGTVDVSEMDTYTTYINTNSTGDVKVRVNHELGFELHYAGNIYYTGNPQKISPNILGSGKLIEF